MWVLVGCLVPQVIEATQRPHIHVYSLLYVFDPFSTLANQTQLRAGLMPAVLGIVGVAAVGDILRTFANLPTGVVQWRFGKCEWPSLRASGRGRRCGTSFPPFAPPRFFLGSPRGIEGKVGSGLGS